MAEQQRLGKLREGEPHDAGLVGQCLDGLQAALSEFLQRKEVIIIEQPVNGQTINDEGITVKVVPIIGK